MNTYLLGGLAVAGLLVLVGVLLLRRRPSAAARDDHRATLPVDTVAADAPARPGPTPPEPAAATHSADAQRLAATEALRQARQRKADEAARLQAERQAEALALAQADARAQAQAQTQARVQAPADARTSAPTRPSPLQRMPPSEAAVAMPTAPPRAPRAPQAPPPPLPAERITPVLSPLAIHTTPGAHAASQPAPAAGLAPLRTPSRPAGPPTVLLADDSKVVRVKTGRLLEKEGWRVLLAEDGQAALQLLDVEGADLLITDVEMPGLDGFALTRRVRAHARWGRLPVIMITSSDDKHRAEATAAGVNLLMGKPYEEAALLAQARQLLGAAAGRIAPGLALH